MERLGEILQEAALSNSINKIDVIRGHAHLQKEANRFEKNVDLLCIRVPLPKRRYLASADLHKYNKTIAIACKNDYENLCHISIRQKIKWQRMIPLYNK